MSDYLLAVKLEAIRERYDNVNHELMQPEVMGDMKRFKSLNKEFKELGRIVTEYRAYQQVLSNIEGARQVISTEKDEDFREMAKAELDELVPEAERLEGVIKDLLIPKDPNDSKDVIMEIRAGAGGDEASLFAGDLQRMYLRFAEKQGWKMELVDAMEGTAGGYKEIVLAVKGEDVYGKLKFESGVHRVQRVPATETQGRIHTSVASIVVMPEAEGAIRKGMIGSGDRSDKIRTYNYPQGRVTDHRIGYTVHNLPSVMDGNIDDFVEQLRLAESAERLKVGAE